MSTLRKDIENFEYNETFMLPSEHKWCFMYDEEGVKKYKEEIEKSAKSRFTRGRVQSNPETTGQYGTML